MERTAAAPGIQQPRQAKRPKKRAYSMSARAEAAEATRGRILEAAIDLFSQAPYDQVSLEAVAERAAVSLPTVFRKFGSKDALFIACAGARSEREFEARAVDPGDVRGAVCTLSARYEEILPMWTRYLGLEERFPAVAQALGKVRQTHLEWLAAVFAPFLPPRRNALHTRRLASLFAATEIYLWWSYRVHLGLDAREAEQCMLEMVESLLDRWSKPS